MAKNVQFSTIRPCYDADLSIELNKARWLLKLDILNGKSKFEHQSFSAEILGLGYDKRKGTCLFTCHAS